MKRVVILMIFVLGAAGLWTGGWHYVASQIEVEIEAFAQADGQTVPQLVCSELEIGGFPFQFAPECTGARIVVGDYDITVGGLQGTALFYRPTHIQLFAQSPMRIEDAFTGSIQDVSWSELRGSVRLDGERIGRISLLASDLEHADGLFGDHGFGSAQTAELHLIDATETEGAPDTGATLDYFVRLTGVQSEPVDIEEGVVTLDGRLTGLPTLDGLGHPDALRIWQANDGALEIRAIDATATGLALNASGGMTLDEAGRVNGTFEISANGVLERFGPVEDDPLMAVLAGTPDADGTYNQTVSVRAGTIQVGIIPVLMLDPLF